MGYIGAHHAGKASRRLCIAKIGPLFNWCIHSSSPQSSSRCSCILLPILPLQPDWTLRQTAECYHLHVGSVSHAATYLMLQQYIMEQLKCCVLKGIVRHNKIPAIGLCFIQDTGMIIEDWVCFFGCGDWSMICFLETYRAGFVPAQLLG